MRDIRGIGFRLLQALNDPARRERSVALVLLTYAALWTLYGVIAKGGQDIHDDMAEQFVIGRDLALGYTKHPPLAVWIVRLWFAVLPVADWAYYLLAMANAAVALWLIWRLCGHFLDGDKRVLGLALLTLVPFFNFHALKFNANTVLLPLWAATTLAFLRSYETRRPLSAAAAGLCAALAMLGKYWSVFLLLGLGLAALADPRRKPYFCSAAPWITIASGAFAFAPHVLWLIQYEFAPFSYAAFVHGEASFRSALTSVVGYVAGGIGYVCLPLLVVLALVRPNLATLKDMAWPSMPKRRRSGRRSPYRRSLRRSAGFDSPRFGPCRPGRSSPSSCCRRRLSSSAANMSRGWSP
jgi:4-amino-4-deoxy-L-arabinose transferase-like glycosyltransferase